MRYFKIVLACLLCTMLCACALLPQEEVRRSAPLLRETASENFKLSYVTRGDLEQTKKLSCTYVPLQTASVKFGVSGEYVDEIYVKVGDTVKKGDLLGQLRMDGVDEKIENLNFEISKAKLNKAHLEEDRILALERQRVLYAKDAKALAEAILSINESYDNSLRSYDDSLELMQMELEKLKADKKLRQLISPIDGTVTYARKYQASSLSDENERAITVADASMSLFSANTENWDMLNVGDRVTITCKKVDYEAIVADETALGLEKIEREAGKRSIVYFTLATPAFDLEDNAKGTLTLVLDSRYDVLLVPQDAISTANGETICYVRDAEGMKTYKKVKLGLNANRYYEVIEGLVEGEEVIVG